MCLHRSYSSGSQCIKSTLRQTIEKILLHWLDNTNNCYYWQRDNVNWKRRRISGAYSRARLVGKCRDPSVSPVEKPRNFRVGFIQQRLIFSVKFIVTRIQVMWALRVERVSEWARPPLARRCSRRIIAGWARVRKRALTGPRRSASSDLSRETVPSRKLHRKRWSFR